MTARLKKTNKADVAILPHKDDEALAAKIQKTDEVFGTAGWSREQSSPLARCG